MNKDFYADSGYEMPAGTGEVPIEGGFDYYKHPAGIYQGVFGKLTAKYKNAEGKKCDSGDAGAQLSHFTAALWITKFLGVVNKKEDKPVLAFTDKFAIPTGLQPAELYFPLMISYSPKDQWKVAKLFENFAIPGHDHLRLIKLNPANPTQKTTNFQAFPAYYGCAVEWIIDLGAQKGSPYCSSIKLLDKPRYPVEAIATLEKEIEQIIQLERDKRKESQQSGYTAPPPPQPDLEDMLGEGDDDIFKNS